MMERALQAGDKEVIFETSSYTVSKHMAQKDAWECAQTDFVFPLYEKCKGIAEKLSAAGVHWEVKFSSEKARLAGTLTQTLTSSVSSPELTKSFSASGNFQTTLNS